MTKPASPEVAREWLNILANYLAKAPNPSRPIAFGAIALKAYLEGQEPSLERAFGLAAKRGRPTSPAHLDIARRILRYRLDGMTWDRIAETFENEGRADSRELRRIYEQHKVAVLSELMDESWAD
ncbi:MAG: hypothetical protein KIS91_02065 [Anaerolineae bacterium]|nr:hypothetical protein [Anaerolineae bacterium]